MLPRTSSGAGRPRRGLAGQTYAGRAENRGLGNHGGRLISGFVNIAYRLMPALLLAVLAATACTGPTPTSPVPDLVLPSPTSAALSLPEAQQRFIAITGPRDEALMKVRAAMEDGKPWTAQRDALVAYIAVNDLMLQQLSAEPWPTTARAAVDAFVRTMVANRQALSDAAQSQNERDYVRRARLALLDKPCAPLLEVLNALKMQPMQHTQDCEE